MANVSQLLLARQEDHPSLKIGVCGSPLTLDRAVDAGIAVAVRLIGAGLEPGERVAVVVRTSTDFLVFWMGCQLAGLEPALINPDYPEELLVGMVRTLRPAAVASADGRQLTEIDALAVGYGRAREGRLEIAGGSAHSPGKVRELPGLDADELALAGFMHTSGTTGMPKFCAQSHRYFLRLGRVLAAAFGWGADDHVLAPLPMFHINPFGYGFIGALTAGADITGLEKFVPGDFWAQVEAVRATSLVLHAPPVNVLQQRTSPDLAGGHVVRSMFYADADFMRRFGISAAISGYGSTEAGGVTHLRRWSLAEAEAAAADVKSDSYVGIGQRVGTARDDVEWKIESDGEIQVRGLEDGVLFDGYWDEDEVQSALDPDQWFATGDLGREVDGELEFLERGSESIRVRGEFIPIQYVERRVAAACQDNQIELALWKAEGDDPTDERAVLYVAGPSLPLEHIRGAIAHLPRFMRPVQVVRIAEMPVDNGAGKVRRRLLGSLETIESCEL